MVEVGVVVVVMASHREEYKSIWAKATLSMSLLHVMIAHVSVVASSIKILPNGCSVFFLHHEQEPVTYSAVSTSQVL